MWVINDMPIYFFYLFFNFWQARHGTRSPTKRRINELDRLATRLAALVEEANREGTSEAPKIPGWIQNWESPWKGVTGGELTDIGEQELYRLALRVRDRFPDIFSRDYHPHIYPLKATQVR